LEKLGKNRSRFNFIATPTNQANLWLLLLMTLNLSVSI
jgi:hypothetical protein